MLKKIVAAIIIIGTASFLAVQIGTSAPDSSGAPPLLATVKRASFDVAITESGVLEALRSVTLCSEIPSNNAKIVYLVPEGTQVEEGDVLVSFDPTPFQEDVRKFQFQVNEAKALLDEARQEVGLEGVRAGQELRAAEHAVRLAELQLENVLKGEGPVLLGEAENNSAQAKAKMDQARNHVTDLEDLHKEEFVTDEELARAQNAHAEAKAACKLADLRYEKRRDYIYPAEKEKARAELAKAQNEAGQLEFALKHRMGKIAAALARVQAAAKSANDRLRAAKDLIAKTAIRAPIPGFVVYREWYHAGEKRKPRIGDSVWTNQGIIVLPDISEMVAQSRIREIDIHKLAVGQEVRVTVDAYPEPPRTGMVDLIGTVAAADERTKSAAKFFSLRVLLEGSDTRLRPGMSARVVILVDEVRDQLVVPVGAVFREGGESFCFTWDGRRAHKNRVKAGPTNNVLLVIENGLNEGDRVYLRKPETGL
jgi:HlyD family secretion protein